MTEEQKNKCEIIINFYEEKYKKDLNELFYNFHEEYVPWALLFHYGDTDTVFYWYNPISMLFGNFVPLSFTLSQMEGVEDKFFEFLGNSKDKAAENIIDIAVSLLEVFNKNITKEEAEKLLFIKNDIEKEDMGAGIDLGAGIPASLGNFCVFTREFGKVIEEYESEDKYYIKSVCWAIANYFDNNKENNNNQNEENKNFNNENKINNVVENTAKEKIMQPKEQRKQCEEIINSYKTELGNFNFIVPNNVSKISPNITLFTIPEYISIITSMTISLAKVFNKDITKKELEKIILDLKEDLKENPDSEKYKDFESMCWSIVEKLDDELKLNLLILGQTGVGKSSLLNALVGEYVEKTSSGLPETPKERINEKGEIESGIYPHEAEIDGKRVIIHDSWGLEVGKDEEWEKIVNEELKKKGIDKDIKDWFHSVTYCIQAGGHKIQDFDIKIIKKFMNEKYNVIIALTKADQIDEEKEKKFIEKIKQLTGINMVIPISANPQKSRGMTEAPKPFGLTEYKAAILISWKNIFIDRIPLHIIKKLKKDIEKAKINAPREGSNLKKLAKEIQEYFINVLKEKLQVYVEENFKKYYKITEDILTVSKNIDISDLNIIDNMDNPDYIFNVFDFNSSIFETIGKGFILLFAPILGGLIGVIQLIYFHATKSERINNYINEISQTMIDKIGEKEFESEIRKIIIETFNEIDKKIIKLN